MKATKEYVEKKFEEFDKQIFGGRLPKIPVLLGDASSYLGQCISDTRRLPDGRLEHTNFRLRINTRIDLEERELEDVIIHEMIHYFILLHGLGDSSAHGHLFKAMMRSINETHGRHISISHRFTDGRLQETHTQRKSWHVIARVDFSNGKTGVKVLPRVIQKVVRYYTAVKASRGVKSVSLFLSNNPFFNRYPNSASLNYHEIERALFDENIRGASILEVQGNKIVQR